MAKLNFFLAISAAVLGELGAKEKPLSLRTRRKSAELAENLFETPLSLLFRKEKIMIARVWRGSTKPEHADAYEGMLKPELLPGISKAKGYRGSYLLRREAGAEVEFITILLWDSMDDIRAVAGPDYEKSIIPEERRKYLSRHDPKANHYEIAATHGLSGG